MFKSNRDYKLYIEDIAFECKNIRKFVENITYEEFTQNLEKSVSISDESGLGHGSFFIRKCFVQCEKPKEKAKRGRH